MCSIVLPWYPGGHVLSKYAGLASLFLRLAWGGIPEEKHKTKNVMTANLSKSAARKQVQNENYKN